jgi:hypothetical protein
MALNVRAPFVSMRDAARQLAANRITVNCFRIDLAVASEGIVWMLRQPFPYSGRPESMQLLREREGIIHARAATRNSSSSILAPCGTRHYVPCHSSSSNCCDRGEPT